MTKNFHKYEERFNLKKFIFIFSVFLLIIYGLFNARNILLGPKIEIFYPSKESETENNMTEIKGRAQNIIFLSLNERPISVDTEGYFEEKMLLSVGFNTIEIKAKDRFKNEVIEKLKIYYKPSATSTADIEIE